MSAKLGENTTHRQVSAGTIHGFVYLVPKPFFRLYTDTKGEPPCHTAMSFHLGENVTETQEFGTGVHGLLYFVPNPALRGYTHILGDASSAIAMSILNMHKSKKIRII
jgi:hypothetical protein